MRRLMCVLGCVVASAFVASPALADSTSIQSILVNANGTLTTDYTGANTVGWDPATGLGTLIFDFNPGPGAYFFDVFFDHSLNLPFFDEFGTVLGAPAAGQSWEIGESFFSNIYLDVLAGGALPNTNSLPGTTSNFLDTCGGGPNCNGDFAAAMGFSFILGADEMARITFNVSHTDPGIGLRLKDTHPIDETNPQALELFISGSAAIVPSEEPPPPSVPEPASLLLLTSVGGPMLLRLRRRMSKRSEP